MNDEHATWRLCRLMVTLIDEVRGMRSDLAARGRRAKESRLSDADRVVLAELLPAAAELFGDGEFGVGLLMRRAAERSSVAKRAKRAIAELNALRLGRLLKRAADVESPISALYVHVVRRSRTGVVYCVDANTAENRAASIFASRMRGTLTK